jgi:hypothetical protein
MKIGLVTASAAAILLLGSLLYWKTRPLEGRAPGSHPDAGPAAAGSRGGLPTEAAGPAARSPGGLSAETPGAAGPKDKHDGRSALDPAVPAEPGLEGDLTLGGELAQALPTSIGEEQRGSDEVFEKRYQGTSASGRSAALAAIKTLLNAREAGGLEKGQSLTDEQVEDFKLEVEWLGLHPNP